MSFVLCPRSDHAILKSRFLASSSNLLAMHRWCRAVLDVRDLRNFKYGKNIFSIKALSSPNFLHSHPSFHLFMRLLSFGKRFASLVVVGLWWHKYVHVCYMNPWAFLADLLDTPAFCLLPPRGSNNTTCNVYSSCMCNTLHGHVLLEAIFFLMCISSLCTK